jgi:hypothetical protein
VESQAPSSLHPGRLHTEAAWPKALLCMRAVCSFVFIGEPNKVIVPKVTFAATWLRGSRQSNRRNVNHASLVLSMRVSLKTKSPLKLDLVVMMLLGTVVRNVPWASLLALSFL